MSTCMWHVYIREPWSIDNKFYKKRQYEGESICIPIVYVNIYMPFICFFLKYGCAYHSHTE